MQGYLVPFNLRLPFQVGSDREGIRTEQGREALTAVVDVFYNEFHAAIPAIARREEEIVLTALRLSAVRVAI